MKFLVDMNLSPRWVDLLRDAQVEARHWSTIGPGDATDSRIFGYAVDNGWVVLTSDLDFGTLLSATGAEKPSVVQIRGHVVRPEAIGPVVLGTIRQLRAELAQGALVTIDPKRVRINILPLRTGR